MGAFVTVIGIGLVGWVVWMLIGNKQPGPQRKFVVARDQLRVALASYMNAPLEDRLKQSPEIEQLIKELQIQMGDRKADEDQSCQTN